MDSKTSIFLSTVSDTHTLLKKCHPNIDENCIIHKPVDNQSLLGQIKSIL